ncbi:epoxide hydrolase 1 [Alligator mississippiensis]|uniref:epoxide hydrolase 1 n=1 Tax=Alligator mississippiensis TaxID=8496 RepID=UPI0003D0E231|nr:epoxide hydrolase 1 [Alligator mississippiensis]XP_019338661.1 epoxide hydrolase 1 [Alligator mississippiensis]XP_059573396.1 epoxide hydrolase 1 [Alligator mississippiensis]
MLLEILLTLAFGAAAYLYFFRKKEETLPIEDRWWGSGQKPDSEEDATVHPFKVETTDEELNDLFRRLDQARFTEPLEDSCFYYGINSVYLRKVVSYWRNQFNWKKQVEVLNKFPHFKTKIDGINVHFLHVKPPHLPEGHSAKPLLMVHGWPGSFYEFYKVISLLTDPASHGLSDEHIFEVICPSIPGYGFSEAPHKQGFDSVCAASVFYKLMLRMGFHEFYAQGGDWGWLICTNLAQIAPNHVKGLHLNLVSVLNMRFTQLLSILLGRYFPGLFGFQEEDVRRMFPFLKKGLYKMLMESGYAHIQATKPDTVGCGLNDSPVGLAAYILEKFSTWTDPEYRKLEDGGLERKYTLDDLLTNVMIYWVSGCMVSAMRFYKENMGKGIGTQKHDKLPVRVPTGVASFPNEIMHTPRSWAQKKYTNIITFNLMPQGGHFAAFEEPELVAADIQQFVGKVEREECWRKMRK